jgi:WD repeat and SOF domain-containing protein 1
MKIRTRIGAINEDGTWDDDLEHDTLDLDWCTVLKRTFEAYIRGEKPNMYGEYLLW